MTSPTWLHLEVLISGHEQNWRTWYLFGNAQVIDEGIAWADDFRRCPFVGRAK